MFAYYMTIKGASQLPNFPRRHSCHYFLAPLEFDTWMSETLAEGMLQKRKEKSQIRHHALIISDLDGIGGFEVSIIVVIIASRETHPLSSISPFTVHEITAGARCLICLLYALNFLFWQKNNIIHSNNYESE